MSDITHGTAHSRRTVQARSYLVEEEYILQQTRELLSFYPRVFVAFFQRCVLVCAHQGVLVVQNRELHNYQTINLGKGNSAIAVRVHEVPQFTQLLWRLLQQAYLLFQRIKLDGGDVGYGVRAFWFLATTVIVGVLRLGVLLGFRFLLHK